MNNPDHFNEPPHPEVTNQAFEACSDTTKEKLFDLVEARAMSGGTEYIGGEEPMHVIQLEATDGSKLELVWMPELPGDEHSDPEWLGGSVIKTDYIRDEKGVIVSATSTHYRLDDSHDGLVLDKEVDEGFTPADDKFADALVDGIQAAGKGFTEEDAQWIAKHALACTDWAAIDQQRQTELELGLNIVSESEAQNLIELIEAGTPLSRHDSK
jgi:hypothetical protein